MGNANLRAAGFGQVLSSETLTPGTGSAVALTVPAGAKSVVITVGANAVRYRSDGTDPTTSVGHFIAANGNIEVFGNEMNDIRLISTSSTSACFITYYGD